MWNKTLLVFAEENPKFFTSDFLFCANLKWFKQTVSLDLGIRNATDEVYFDHLSRYKYQGIFNQGRNFYLSLRVPFEFKMKEKSH